MLNRITTRAMLVRTMLFQTPLHRHTIQTNGMKIGMKKRMKKDSTKEKQQDNSVTAVLCRALALSVLDCSVRLVNAV